MRGLNLVQLRKSFSGSVTVDGVSLQVTPGEIVAVVGPSGSGKSTLLALIAGLETPEEGQILWDGQDLARTPPHQRGFGLMFQDYALFPHLNVKDNIGFGLRMGQSTAHQIEASVTEALALVGLPGFERRDVNTLSGGEMQRVALARSLAPHPRLLMLDEPLGALDRALRERLVLDLQQILRASHQTALYVTHDQEEAFTLADRVAIMHAGKLIQVATPATIYNQPASIFVARFLGLGNLFPCRVIGDGSLDTALGRLPQPHTSSTTPRQTTLLLRADGFKLNSPGSHELSGEIIEVVFRGPTCRVVVRIHETRLELVFPTPRQPLEPGNPVRLGFEPDEALQILDD